MLKKGDISLILFVVLVVCAALFWRHHVLSSGPETSNKAVITQDGRLIAQINLDDVGEPVCLTINSGILILAEKGRIRFQESGCPDKLCVKTGWLTEKGDKAVCVPTKTIIRIEGEGQVDSLSY